MRLEPVRMKKNDSVNGFLEFFMGKNTPDRQDFIIENLRIEEDIVEEEIVRDYFKEVHGYYMEEEDLDISNTEGKEADSGRTGCTSFCYCFIRHVSGLVPRLCIICYS